MRHSLDDFANTDAFSEEEVKQIVLEKLILTKENPVVNETNNRPEPDDNGNDPPLSLLVDSMDDITFTLLEKQLPDNHNVRWVARVITPFSWNINFLWQIQVDPHTGEVVSNDIWDDFLPVEAPRKD